MRRFGSVAESAYPAEMRLAELITAARDETAAGVLGWLGGWPGIWLAAGSSLCGMILGGMTGTELGGPIGGVIGFAISTASLFGFNLTRAEARLLRERAMAAEARAAAAEKKLLGIQSGTAIQAVPDLPLYELCELLHPDIPPEEKNRAWLAPLQEIENKLRNFPLRSWGARYDDLQVELLPEYWDKYELKTSAACRGLATAVHTSARPGSGALERGMANLHVNKSQAEAIWPEIAGKSRLDGDWQDGEFIYRHPVMAFQRRLFAADDNGRFPFTLPGIPGDAFIRFRIEFAPDNQYWMGTLGTGAAGGFAFDDPPQQPRLKVGRTGGIRISDRSVANLHVWTTRSDVASAIVRVWIQSWTRKQRDIPI